MKNDGKAEVAFMPGNLMTLDEMRQHEWVVSWSGGKDSTATIILMHENNVPIKEIIYVRMMYDDTIPATLPVMTEFVDKSKPVFESWGYNVRFVYPDKSAIDYMNATYKKSKFEGRVGKTYGVTAFMRQMCKLEGSKEKAVKLAANENDYQMIGYAADEVERHKKLGNKKQSIMLALGVEEQKTYEICRKYNLLSPLYELGFTRDGCWFCPNARKAERNYLRAKHPELVDKINQSINQSINQYTMELTIKSGRNKWLDDWYKEKIHGIQTSLFDEATNNDNFEFI